MSNLSKLLASLALPTLVLALGAATPQAAQAAPVVHDFESLADLDSVTSQLPGLTFSNAIALTAGLSLNEFEFPPHSDFTVLSDAGGAMTIDFSGPVFSVGAYFTYVESITLVAFNGAVSLGTLTSTFADNTVSSGNGPNEFFQFSSLTGSISRLVITGNASGGSFVMDDLTVDAGNTVPEPHTLALLAGVLAIGAVPGGWLRRRKPR